MTPRIHHFIVRPEVIKRHSSGLTVEQSLVPLIPIDELPEWLDILNVPRSLAPEQTAGLTNLGCYERKGVHEAEILIDGAASDASTRVAPEQNTSSASGGMKTTGTATPTQPGSNPAPPLPETKQPAGLDASRWADAARSPGKPRTSPPVTTVALHPADRMMAHVSPSQLPTTKSSTISPGTTSSTTTSLPQTKSRRSSLSTQPPESKKRAYCRHWIHHGTCKWGLHCPSRGRVSWGQQRLIGGWLGLLGWECPDWGTRTDCPGCQPMEGMENLWLEIDMVIPPCRPLTTPH